MPFHEVKPVENEVKIWALEDNEIYSRGLQRAIDQIPWMKCTGKYKSAEQAFADLESGFVPDLILLDIQLSDNMILKIQVKGSVFCKKR
jgi:DNA-binding NarL/FixJ family response regulator